MCEWSGVRFPVVPPDPTPIEEFFFFPMSQRAPFDEDLVPLGELDPWLARREGGIEEKNPPSVLCALARKGVTSRSIPEQDAFSGSSFLKMVLKKQMVHLSDLYSLQHVNFRGFFLTGGKNIR